MADIKFSEFLKATTSKDSDEIAILQDGVNKMIASPVLESKIINKTVSRVIEQGGASLNVINLKGVVPTYADLATITPTPELNDAYQVEADGLVYVYTENGFQADGEGFLVQPEPTGVVEEGNTQAVSGGEVFNEVSLFFEKGENILVTLSSTTGRFTASGEPSASQNWISTNLISGMSPGEEVYSITGQDQNQPKNIFFYTQDDTLNQNPLTLAIDLGDVFEFTKPAGYTKMTISVARGSNISGDIPYYQSIFKLNKGVSKLNSELIKDRINSHQLLEIESNIEYLNDNVEKQYYGFGFPTYELGNTGNKYTNKSTSQEFLKSDNGWIPKTIFNEYLLNVPTDFTMNIEYPILISRNNTSRLDWNGLFNEKVKVDFDTLTKYYISPTGLDSNDGLTPNTPFLNVTHALSLGARNIILKQGIYSIGKGWFGNLIDNDTTTEPLILRCLEGKAIITRSYLASEYTFTANDNIWQANRTGVVVVTDLTNIDEFGNEIYMQKVSTVSECKLTKNSYCSLSGIIYINTFDGRKPDKNVLLTFNFPTTYIPGQNVPYVYMENLHFLSDSGNNALNIINNTTTQYNAKVYLKSVTAVNNTAGNAIGIDNIKEAIVEGCGGANVLRDALNYHTSLLTQGYTPIKVLEVDCYGYNTGTYFTGVYSSNGSTIHEGGSICRINGYYNNGSGSVVADVNDGVLSLNVCTIANNAKYASGFRINGIGSKMWLFGCTASSLTEGIPSLVAEAGSKAFFDNKTELPNGYTGDVTNL